MTATETATAPATNSEAHAPEITIFTRVAGIPLISSSLETIDDALTNNAYTRSTYAHAKELSNTAYRLTEPIQVKLAPLIIRADDIANKAVDIVEARYPYPFKAQPEEVVNYVRETKESTINGVNKTIDDKVKTPAYNVATGIDQRLSPFLDYFEARVNGSSEAAGPSSPDAQYQYQRALALSRTLSDNIYVYSSEQLKHLQAQNVFAQKASETAHSITTAASESLSSAQTRIHGLSDNMLAELRGLQSSTAQLTASLQSSVQPQIQQAYADLSGALLSTVQDLSGIITEKDTTLQEKATRINKEVLNRVNPLLEAVKKGVSEVLARSKAATGASNGTANGNGHPAPEDKH